MKKHHSPVKRPAYRSGKWLVLMALITAVVLTSCSPAAAVPGETIKVDYTLTLDDGSVYYTTSGRGPLEYTLGKGALLPGFEEAVIGMRAGDSKTVTVPPEKAYGTFRHELVQEVSRDRLPEGFEPAVGKQLQTTLNGTPVIVVIREVTPTSVTVDANHVLAGKNLTFNIELVSIGAPTASGSLANQSLLGVLAGVLVALIGAFVIYYIRAQRRLQKLTTHTAPVADDKILAEIASLDDDFEVGRIAGRVPQSAGTEESTIGRNETA